MKHTSQKITHWSCCSLALSDMMDDVGLMTRHALVDSWLTHWGRVTYIYVRKLTVIGSDNGLSPGRHQAIIWINAEMCWKNYRNSHIFIEENTSKNVVCEMSISSGPQYVKTSTEIVWLQQYIVRFSTYTKCSSLHEIRADLRFILLHLQES